MISLLACERRKKGWRTLRPFAARLGYSLSYCSMLERGEKVPPELVQCYAQLLGHTPARIRSMVPRQPLPRGRRA